MRDIQDELDRRQIRVVVVGNGTPDQAQNFKEVHRLDFEVLVDPERKAYQAVGFHRSIMGSVGPRAMWTLWKAFRSGHPVGKLQGDPWQMGGTVMIAPPGELLYLKKSRYSGDHSDIGKILDLFDEFERR